MPRGPEVTRGHWLERRVPPPVIGLLGALLTWALRNLGPGLSLSDSLRLILALALAVAGVSVGAAGLRAFRRAATTISPHRPERSTALVTTGIYRLTRNPMYLGIALALLGWWVWWSGWSGLAGPALFVVWITRYQIRAEERALAGLFGTAYRDYRQSVRRWI